MTREEAIERIGDIKRNYKRMIEIMTDNEAEAFNMAIKALEQETIQEIQAESEKYQKAFEDGYEQGYAQAKFDYEQEPCEDAISRKAVLDMTTAIRTSDYSRIIEVVDIDDVKALPSVKPQEPFDIETYCKEHFCVMVDKDVWEKAEKALKQEPCEDRLYNIFSRIIDNMYNELSSVKPQEPKTEQFVKWVATEIFDEMWEYNYEAFAEIACRKLSKLGIVVRMGGEWVLVEPEERSDKE